MAFAVSAANFGVLHEKPDDAWFLRQNEVAGEPILN